MEYLYKNRKEYGILHACDFDTVLPALVMQVLGKKVIFDIFDWFSDETKTGKWFVDKTVNFLEQWAVRQADLVVLCEKGRLRQIQAVPKQYLIISNIPLVRNTEIVLKKDFNKSIGYVGGIVADRGLVELVHVVSELPDWQLHIAGFGDENIVSEIESYSRRYNNICFYGKVAYEKALKIMQGVDILYAMYYTHNRNHIFAAPNKFYEAIFLQKPIITTKGTLVGEKVKEVSSGYVIGEGEDDLRELLRTITLETIQGFQVGLQEMKSLYSTLFDDSMLEYLTKVQELKNNETKLR